jgi:hypothetical protein
LVGRAFFPQLIGASFRSGLRAALDFAIVASLFAAAASWVRGSKVSDETPSDATSDAAIDANVD